MACISKKQALTNIDQLVYEFSNALRKKLRKAEAEHERRGQWQRSEPEDLYRAIEDHFYKGDPLDVAAFCAFFWKRGLPISDHRRPGQ